MSRQDDLKKLIAKHQRRLQKRQEQQATLGINTPPEVLTEIEDIQAELVRLRADMCAANLAAEEAALRQTLQHLPKTAEFRREIANRLAAIEKQLIALAVLPADRSGQPVSLPSTDPVALRQAYLHRLAQQTRRLPLAGVDPKAVGTEDAQQLQLAAVYTALFTRRPRVEQEIKLHPRETFPQRIEAAIHNIQPLSAVEALNREAHLVLLGDPGSGKSTFVNFVGLCLAGELLDDPSANLSLLTAPLPVKKESDQDQPQPWAHGPLLPVRIVLRDAALEAHQDAMGASQLQVDFALAPE